MPTHKHTHTAQRACRVKISSKQWTQAKDQPESNFKTVCLHLLHLPILKDFFKDDDLAHTTYHIHLGPYNVCGEEWSTSSLAVKNKRHVPLPPPSPFATNPITVAPRNGIKAAVMIKKGKQKLKTNHYKANKVSSHARACVYLCVCRALSSLS